MGLIDNALRRSGVYDNPSVSEGDVGTTTSGACVSSSAVSTIRVPGAFSSEPELRRRAVATAKKLSPEEERILRASELQRAVSSREVAGFAGTTAAVAAAAQRSDRVAGEQSAVPAVLHTLSRKETPGESGNWCAQAMKTEAGTKTGICGAVTLEGAVGVSGEATAVDGRGDLCPRRRVKAAPQVLAFLTKEYSARALTARTSREVNEAIKTDAATAPGMGVQVPRGAQSLAAAVATGPALVSAAGVSAVPPPPPPPPKPMSKSLTALLAQQRNRLPGLVGGIGNGGSGGGASRKTAAPALGFFQELKARAAAKAASPSP